MNKKVWIYKGLSMIAAMGSVICCIYHKVEMVFLFAVLAVIFSVIGDKSKKSKK